MHKFKIVLLGAALLGVLPSCFAETPLIVRSAPPPVRTEYVGQPRAGYVFIQGHWAWSGADWRWAPGYWAQQRQGYTYRRGGWNRAQTGWVWRDGRWERY